MRPPGKQDFATLYWRSVIAQLCTAGMSDTDARLAVMQYRERMKGAGETIYNDSTSASAMWAKRCFERPVEAPANGVAENGKKIRTPKSEPVPQAEKSVSESYPSYVEIIALPRWVRIAFAARHARRVLPLFAHLWPEASQVHLTAVERAVKVAEHAASTASSTANTAVTDAASAAASAAGAAGTRAHLAALAAHAASSAAYADGVGDAHSAAGLASHAPDHAAHATTLDIRPLLWGEFHALSDWARANHATDTTPCPPIVAGPLWPHGVPEGWPALPMPKQFGLTIHVPDEVDLTDEQEAMRIAARFATQFAKLDIVGGGHGLVLKPPLKISAVRVKSCVSVGVGKGGGDDEPPERSKAGKIEVTIEADKRDDPSILTAVVQALQGGPVFHDVADHGAPSPAKSEGKRKPLTTAVVKLTERRIEDGLRKATEELLPPGTDPKFDPARWVVELQTLWNYLDGLKASGYEIVANLIDDDEHLLAV